MMAQALVAMPRPPWGLPRAAGGARRGCDDRSNQGSADRGQSERCAHRRGASGRGRRLRADPRRSPERGQGEARQGRLRCRPARSDAAGFQRSGHGQQRARPCARPADHRVQRLRGRGRAVRPRGGPRRRPGFFAEEPGHAGGDAARHRRLDRAQASRAVPGPSRPPRSADGARQPAAPGRALRARGRPGRAPGQLARAARDRAGPLSAHGRADGQRVRRGPAVRAGRSAASEHPPVGHPGAGARSRLRRPARRPPWQLPAPTRSPASCAGS